MATTIVGLDLGKGVLRAAEIAEGGKSRPTLVRYHSLTLPSSAIQRGEVIESNTVTTALKQLWSQAGFSTKRVALGMGNQRVMVRDISVPKMPLVQIKETLAFQVQELLPVPVADAILDFYPISSGRSDNGEIINGLLVAAVKDSVLKNVEAVQAAGLNPVAVDLVPFALSRAFLDGADGAGTVALIHIGAVTTSIVIAVNGVPQFVRIVQNGGDDVTGALVQQLGIDASQADQIKRGLGLASVGVSPEWQPAVDIITRATGDLLDSIRNTLSFYINTRSGSVDRVVLSGGGSHLNGLPQALAEAVRLPVGIPDPLQRFQIAKSVDVERIRTEITGVPVAAGLALGSRAA
ncbi:MAG: type IV pilus assembly protein PilM [Gordonia polyisoprenivorans]|nr:type IV pilus assembly protein PilM [Gordonia polyisoprenivorans]